MDPALVAALAAGLSQYVVVLIPSAGGAERPMAVAAIWLLTLVNMAGLRVGGRVLAAITILKVAALAGVVLAAFTIGHGSWSHFVPLGAGRAGGPPLGEALALGLVSVFFSFGGFWDASRMAGDVRNPGRTLPLALAAGVGILTLIYALTTAAFMYLVPPGVASSPAEFARAAGVALVGSAGPSILAAVVVVSVLVSATAFLLMAPRLYVAMGQDGLFPAPLAEVHSATQTPVRALLVLGCLASVYAWFGRFDQIVALMICPALVFIALAAAGLSIVRARGADGAAEFETPGYPWTPGLFVVLVSGVVVLVALGRPQQAALGGALILLGVPAYRWFGPSRR